MSNEIIEAKLALDVFSNMVTTLAQTGKIDFTITAPFVGSDLLYSFAIKQYIQDNFGGSEGLADEFSRDTFFKTFITGFIIWLTQTFTGTGSGLVIGTLNALVSYTASDGLQDILNIK